MNAKMNTPGPVTSPTRTWEEQQQRAFERRPRGWEGFKVDEASGLTPLEIEALQATGQLAA